MDTLSRRSVRVVEFAALAVTLIVLAASAARAQSPANDSGLQPGDKVTVTVWMRPELSGDFTVAQDGSLNHPLYRQVRVMDVPATQVEERLQNFLRSYEANPQVVVQPFYKVAIAGSVMRPDIYDLPPGTTVAQAVTRAGGVTEAGERDDVRLFRQGNEIRLDLTELEAVQMPVQSGDQIQVKVKDPQGLIRGTIIPIIQIGFWIANIVVWQQR
jgi:protein involved in polysaccharide export with SLBB domain